MHQISVQSDDIKESSEEEFVFALKSEGDKNVPKVMVMVNGVPDV